MIDDSTLCLIAQNASAEINEQISFAAKKAHFSAIPDDLELEIKQRIEILYPNGLYFHQAKAIDAGLKKRNICIATPTASGKTLIFTSVAISHLLKSKNSSVVLALYPAKALLRDQKQRWQDAVLGMNIKLAVIDGGIEISERIKLLSESQIILMTPDVLHAWLLSNLEHIEIQKFLTALDIVVLDEAHIYDGIFGTNMAYLLHRLRAVSGVNQFLASSATIGDPIGFLKLLTGFEFDLIAGNDDGASVPEKTVMLCRMPIRKTSKFFSALFHEYSLGKHGRFLIFADSRKRVEELAAESYKMLGQSEEDNLLDEDIVENIIKPKVLPYRAGYEEEDREAIQNALTTGGLLGVVTTSALELGIDIGDIELVIMLGEPPSIKSFWQRAGRAGRRDTGHIVLIDLDGRITSLGLQDYIERKPEPNWLYLDNEYLQYANALCAAEEQQKSPKIFYSRQPFATLPNAFVELLDNELFPTRPISSDLYPLKQQAIASPHRAFPLRSGIEKTYQVTCRQLPNMLLGTLSYSQALREAFPGAIYRYLTKPYRVFELKHAKGEIITSKSKSGRTSPIVQTSVFPQFTDHLYYIRKSTDAFVAECRLQVSERVIGFIEQFGQNKTENLYGVGSNYSQKPLNRYIDTTGVCFYFAEESLQREKIGKYICSAFCKVCSVQERDVGWGAFISQISPLNSMSVKGFSIYDSSYGSLRLTKQIPLYLDEILQEAERIANEEGAPQVALDINQIRLQIEEFDQPQEHVVSSDIFESNLNDGWISVVAPNQIALCHDGQSHINEEVTVLGYVYTPQGIRYKLKPKQDDVTWLVCAKMIHPINGVTNFEKYNVNTGETEGI